MNEQLKSLVTNLKYDDYAFIDNRHQFSFKSFTDSEKLRGVLESEGYALIKAEHHNDKFIDTYG